MHLCSNGTLQRYPHTAAIAKQLRRIERGEIRRLAISTPPQHGKSSLVTQAFPSWYLGKQQHHRVICGAYGKTLSEVFGRSNREKLEAYGRPVFDASVSRDDRSVFSWSLEGHEDGPPSLLSVGVGSGTTGFPANGWVIDDPIKSWEQAMSKSQREAIWAWYQSVAMTRLAKDGWVVVVATRWHQDDLIGKVLKATERSKTGEPWTVLNLPAINEGRALCPDLHPLHELEATREMMSDFMWSCLYKGEPAPAEDVIWGSEPFEGVFYPTDFDGVDDTKFMAGWPVGEIMFMEMAVDTSYGNPNSDYQSITLMGFTGKGHIYVEFGLGRQGLTSFAEKVARMASRVPIVPTIHIEEFKFSDGRAAVTDAVKKALHDRGLGAPIKVVNPAERDIEDAPKSGIKDARIMSLDGAINKKLFRFIDTPETRQGVDQLVEFRLQPRPREQRVDACDSMARAYSRTRTSAAKAKRVRNAAR